MTFLGEPDAASAEPEPEVIDAGPVKFCALPDCPNEVPPSATPGKGAPAKYCDDHKGNSPAQRRVRRAWLSEHGAGPTNGDRPPRVVVDLGGKAAAGKARHGAKPEQLAAVEARALQIAQLTAAVILMATSGPHREADAADIAMGAPGWAAAVKELAVYEPWVRKLAAGGEMSERAMAWVAVVMATAGIASPILVRHEIISGRVTQLAETLMANGQGLADAAGAEPEAPRGRHAAA